MAENYSGPIYPVNRGHSVESCVIMRCILVTLMEMNEQQNKTRFCLSFDSNAKDSIYG